MIWDNDEFDKLDEKLYSGMDMAFFFVWKGKIYSEYGSVWRVWKVEFVRKVYYYGRVYIMG